MTSAPSEVLFVGALTLDTMYRVDNFSNGPGKYVASGSIVLASGMAANAATAAARLGGRAALWASAGSDSVASMLVDGIAEEGVDCSRVRQVRGGRSATATIIVDASGERWVVVDYDPITQAAPEPSETPDMSRFGAVLADVRWPGASRLALKGAGRAGVASILDADVAPRQVLEELAPLASHIVASAPGAYILSDETSPEAAALSIAKRFGCFTCVTDGGAGSVWTKPGTNVATRIPNPALTVVDTNGAGDVFHGAFALAIAEGESEPGAIRFASAAAALKCSVMGGRLGAPDRHRTLQLLNETYSDCG